MRSPTAPANTPDPGWLVDPTPTIANDVGPELLQADAGAARFLGGLTAGAVSQGRPVGSTVDGPSPQRWRSAPDLRDAVNTTAVGDETASESLPGKLRPSTWDGEATWQSALGGV